MKTCKRCQHTNPDDSRYCERCGIELNREQQRRKLQWVYALFAVLLLAAAIFFLFGPRFRSGKDLRSAAFHPDYAETLLSISMSPGFAEQAGIALCRDFLEKEYGGKAEIMLPTNDTQALWVHCWTGKGFKAVRLFREDYQPGLRRMQQAQADLLITEGPAGGNDAFAALLRKNENYLCSDAVVVHVHNTNPVKRFTGDEVSLIRDGLLKRWEQLLSEKQGDMHDYSRLLFPAAPDPHYFTPGSKSEKVSSGIDSVETDPDGFALRRFSQNGKGRMIALLDDSNRLIKPGAESIAGLDYPWVVPVLAYPRPNAESAGVQQFLKYARSKGQQVLQQQGFVNGRMPVLRKAGAGSTVLLNPAVPEALAARYTEATLGARRISKGIRFFNGKPDAEGLREIGILGELAPELQKSHKTFTLIAYGSPEEGFGMGGLAQCHNRAAAVRQLLSLYGWKDVRILNIGPLYLYDDGRPRSDYETVELWAR
jgi:predicted nucleic acid-binding Zn ribbon protein